MLTLRPVEGKFKSKMICAAFAAGAPSNVKGHVFFGVNETNLADWNRVRKSGEDWYYVDNAYFDKHRGIYFRATKNALQCSGRGESTGERFAQLDVEIKPWRTDLGTEILLCPQSDSFMRTIGYRGNWTQATLSNLVFNGYPFRVRPWTPDKTKAALALPDMLKTTRVLVTHSSASAITAMFEGVPAISESGAAHELTGPLCPGAIANPPRPEGREHFAHVLADNMFTLEEFKDGTAWRWMNP